MSRQCPKHLQGLSSDKISFIEQLNRIRIEIRDSIDTPSDTYPLVNTEFSTLQKKSNEQNQEIIKEVKPQKMVPYLLQTMLLFYQNKHRYNLEQQIIANLMNSINLIRVTEHNKHKKDACKTKMNVKWGIKNKKNQAVTTLFSNKNCIQTPIGTVSSLQQNKRAQQKQIKQQIKKTPVQFVSASSLPMNIPKGTSLRKKFVPPFKKQKSENEVNEPFKEKIGKSGEDDDEMDPRFKNLQKKLVQLIESQIVEKNSKVQWAEIAGLGFAKKIIHQMIVWPMLRPDIFTGLRSPPKSILFFGPPGTGKTMIGRAIASQANATFFSISASSLTSKWVGESEKLVKTLFAVARLKSPSVIFIDQIDSLLCSRRQGEQQSSRRVKTQFLVQLDGAKSNNEERVLVIGATNLPQQLDDAVRRRFIKRLYIPLPNKDGRNQLISRLTGNSSFKLKTQDIEQISELTKGYSGADLYNLCAEASMIPLRNIVSIENIRESEVPLASLQSFYEAIELVRPSVNDNQLQSFESWNKMFGSYQFSNEELENAKK